MCVLVGSLPEKSVPTSRTEHRKKASLLKPTVELMQLTAGQRRLVPHDNSSTFLLVREGLLIEPIKIQPKQSGTNKSPERRAQLAAYHLVSGKNKT